MKILGSFQKFADRVLDAVKKGGLEKLDQIKLNHLLERTGRHNLVLAKGLLSAFDAGGASKKDIQRFGELLDNANHRILEDKPPFTSVEKNEISAIFRRAYLSDKAAGRFTKNIDELLAEQIKEGIEQKPEISATIPKKKEEEKEKKLEKKLTA